MKRVLLTAILSLFITQASATIITFNELANDNSFQFVNPVSSGGFLFTNSQGTSDGLGVWGRNSSFQADPGFASVFVNYSFTTTTMTQVGGTSFDFTSIDLSDVYNSGAASTIQFVFNYSGGGSSNSSVTLDSLIGLQTFSFNQLGLNSVSWVTTSGDNGFGQFDNVVVNGGQVPEPATLALLGLGLFGLGATRRRKQMA